MGVLYAAEGIRKPKIKYRLISKWIKKVIDTYSYKIGSISYIFCSDEYLREINIKFLQHDYFTDIITFNYCDGQEVSGDLFISLDRVSDNSLIFGSVKEDELLRVMIHGVLHLLGFNDTNSEEIRIMRLKEEQCLSIYKDLCE